jgi:hypothetical protein
MQIHELTKRNITEASIADRIKTGMQNIGDRAAVANATMATAQQDKTQAQAAKYAQILQRQGYGTAATAPAPTGALQPGQRIKIVVTQPNGTQSNYYKTNQGWENELGQPIKNVNSITYLDKLYARRPAAGAVQTTSAGAVQTGAGASAVMTSVDVDQAIRQLGLSQEQLKAFQAQATQNPGFVQAFLKRLGLVR